MTLTQCTGWGDSDVDSEYGDFRGESPTAWESIGFPFPLKTAVLSQKLSSSTRRWEGPGPESAGLCPGTKL